MTATTFRRTAGDRGFDLAVHVIVVAAFVVTLYPFLYVVSMSLSETDAVLRDEVWLLPKGLQIDAYRAVLMDDRIWRSYYNTIWYTTVGTLFNLVFTVMAAYPLSKRKFFARNFFMVAIMVTFLFQGGIIPTFIIVARLGLYGSRWALVFPALISVYYLVICRTFFQQLPEDLFESARLEGAEEWRIVWKIVLPLSQPIVAVLALFYGIQHWNSFFPALLYLPDADLHPIQIYLRRVVVMSRLETLLQHADTGDFEEGVLAMIKVKYAVIVVAIAPIVMLYPFLQRYFVKGVMIGALKG